ncbi:glycosyltransferase [Paenirhodobacter sp. CAU 1674]|uniref:glycosyltransferase n=1 Tax=Paenirhodobacter sp. CAU 1674 TaxID=3032596 RepID=UPI0023DCD7E5|nr:glycosyltransferase [Paenirhodobacter sp. CAU 1674]MDF2143296.1 glycosyltransferase [Paenirhodobacter sp. CAU 1674]
MISKLLDPVLIKRFFTALREEGPRQALRKVRVYLGMIWRGGGRSSVMAAGRAPSTDHLYLNGIWQDLARGHGFHVSQPPAVLARRRKIALIGDLNLPQCRKYRIEQLAGFWQGRGVDVTFAHYQDVPRCVNALQDATHLFEYRLQNFPVVTMYRYEARRLRLPVLYDLDDPLFSVSAYETYENMQAVEPALKAHFLSEAPKYLEAMNGADMLTVSTPGMVEHTRLYTRRPVHLRRNFADAETLEQGRDVLARRQEDGLFRAVFASGSRGHEVDFALIQDAVIGFLDADKTRRLMILGHFDETLLPKALHDRIERHGFSTYGAYLATLAQADCALMPLTDDIFNRCKSAVRVIDAAAVQVPSIVGTVGDLHNVVVPGQTGFVARTASGWRDAMEALARDRSLRHQMGKAARQDLETRWGANDGAHIISPEVLDWVHV